MELMQLHGSVGHLKTVLEVHSARQEAQWLGMMTRMQKREHKCDAHHEDDKLWGAGITNINAKVLKGVAPCQDARDEHRGKTAKMDGGGLEDSHDADTTQERGPEKHQQLQQWLKSKLLLKLQPKLHHLAKLK